MNLNIYFSHLSGLNFCESKTVSHRERALSVPHAHTTVNGTILTKVQITPEITIEIDVRNPIHDVIGDTKNISHKVYIIIIMYPSSPPRCINGY